MTLLAIPMELGGDWEGSASADVLAVLGRMREACLHDVVLHSDRQPERLRVDDHPSGPPYIWLHTDNPTTGWIVVDIRTRDWCNLAYQFGHELGHVVCNSWQPDGAPRNPCQWVEEAFVEAFSLRGLAQMAIGWAASPPFPNDSAYAAAISAYRAAIVEQSLQVSGEQGMPASFSTWFKKRAADLAIHGGVNDARGAVSTMLGLLEAEPQSVADLGALNRWPERSGLPLPQYLAKWQASCAELATPGILPTRVATLVA